MDALAAVRKRTRARRVKRGLLLLLGLALLAAIALAYRPRPVDVDLGEVRRGALEVSVVEPGRTRVRERYVVSAPVGGNLQRIALKAGDPVKRGQVVARLTSPTSPLLDARSRLQADAQLQAARDALAQARAAAQQADTALAVSRSELARNRALREAGTVPQRTLDLAELEARARTAELQSAQSAVRVAGHEVERAQAARGALGGRGVRQDVGEVRSPVDGWVLKVVQESEGMVAPGAPLLELGDPADLEVVVDLLTQDAVRVRPGARALLEHWGGEGALRGQVRRVEPAAFTRVSALGVEEQRVNVLVALAEPRERWGALGDGFRVETRITQWEGRDVLQVPESALFRSGERWAVFVAQEGRLRLRPVEVGERNGVAAEVRGGLEAGERVVLHPGDRAADGVRYAERPQG